MEFLSPQSSLLCVSLVCLFGQLFVRKKRTIHIVFAVFCGSIAMFASKQIGDEQLGAYAYLLGMGACATCNGFWLVARALFRNKNAITATHILAAGGLAILLIAGQGMGLAQSLIEGELTSLQNSRIALYEVVNLFSSCILVLAAWEGIRGISKLKGEQLWQRLLFLASYCSAVITSTVLIKFAGSAEASAELGKLISAVCAIQIIIVTQVLIFWRFHQKSQTVGTENCGIEKKNESNVETDQLLAKQIEKVLQQQSLFLQPNLKVADLARRMMVSEYRISRVFRYNFNARNFNQYINEMRIEHSKTLLQNPDNDHWPILVISMESGFASIGPFTRSFKSICGVTPNEYRQFRTRDSLVVVGEIRH